MGRERRRAYLSWRPPRKPLRATLHAFSPAPAARRRRRACLRHFDRGTGNHQDARAAEPRNRAGDRADLRESRCRYRTEFLAVGRGSQDLWPCEQDHQQRERSVNPPWWRGASIYQVYVRSFADSNGDGIGDFSGLISKLDYIAALGVDAIWLSPIHPSPNRDWGYDVSDYDSVHPDYGTLDDFSTLIEAAHARGLKIILDEVLAHTSA